MVDFDISNLKLDGIKNGKTQALDSGFKIDEKAKINGEIQAFFSSSSSTSSEELGLSISSSKTKKSTKSGKTDNADKTSQSEGSKIKKGEKLASTGDAEVDAYAQSLMNRADSATQAKIKNTKKASNGLTYNQAEAILDELIVKYNNVKQTKLVSWKDDQGRTLGFQRDLINEEIMSGEDKEKLNKAHNAMVELAQKYNLDDYSNSFVAKLNGHCTAKDRIIQRKFDLAQQNPDLKFK